MNPTSREFFRGIGTACSRKNIPNVACIWCLYNMLQVSLSSANLEAAWKADLTTHWVKEQGLGFLLQGLQEAGRRFPGVNVPYLRGPLAFLVHNRQESAGSQDAAQAFPSPALLEDSEQPTQDRNQGTLVSLRICR